MKNKINSSDLELSKTINRKIMSLLFVVFALIQVSLKAQTTIQIGTGTDLPAFTAYGPVYRYSATSATMTSRSNMLFTAAEMSAAGIPAGSTITGIEFYKGNVASFTASATQSMYMANTLNTALTTSLTWASVMSTHTLVYSDGAFTVPNGIGWVSWTLTPFLYTGGALEIASEQSMSGNGGATDKFQWQYTSGVAVDKLVGATTGSLTPATTLTSGVSGYRNRPNIKITYTAPLTSNELSSWESVQLFPNPATNKLTISYPAELNLSALKLFNFSGQDVYSQNGITNAKLNHKIDVSDLPKGIYFLQLTGKDGLQTRKLVIE